MDNRGGMTENGKEQTKADLDESHNKLYIVLKCIVEEKVQLFIYPLCPLCVQKHMAGNGISCSLEQVKKCGKVIRKYVGKKVETFFLLKMLRC